MELATELDPELWSDLPGALWHVILPLLPFSTLLKFRLVCKDWNELITTPWFARNCAKPLYRKGVPLLCPVRGVAGAVDRCVRADDSAHGEVLQWEKLRLGEGENCRYLIACDGGLMLFDTEHPDRFVVCNPVTRRCREVECPSTDASSSVVVGCVASDSTRLGRIAGLVANRETGNYKLVIVSIGDENGDGRTTCIYDSARRAWTSGAPMIKESTSSTPGLETCETFLSPGAVTCNGSLYCVVGKYKLHKRDGWLWKVGRYNVVSDCWNYTSNLVGRTDLFAGSFRSGLPALPDIQLVRFRDRIIMISKVRNSIWLSTHHSRSICYNTFAILLENERSMSVLGHTLPRAVIRKLLQEKESGPYIELPCTFAGYDVSIYFTHQDETYDDTRPEGVEGDARVVRVGFFETQNPDWHMFLPDYFPDFHPSPTLGQGLDNPMRMKIWVLEPSLIACV